MAGALLRVVAYGGYGYDSPMIKPEAPDDSSVRIAMWSGPRNLSTALMRSWENRADCVVLDEPLYAWHLSETGMDHPMRAEVIAAGPADLAGAVQRCCASLPSGLTVSYQKHMSAHLPPVEHREWLDQLTHGLLLRHPYRVLRSYAQKWEVMPLVETGLPQQLDLLERSVVVVDSDDFLTNPPAYLEAMCDAFGVPFLPSMLKWPSGPRDSDGVWASVWYDSVVESTKFGDPPGQLPSIDDLGPGVRPIAEQALSLYEQLAANRLVL